MRFTSELSTLSSQNGTLRFVILLLTVTTTLLGIASVKLGLRDPLIVERECLSTSLRAVDPKHTKNEIEAFVKFALPKRFDTNANELKVFLSEEEIANRGKEQEDLTKKNVSQRLIVNTVKVDGTTVTAENDRILSIGKIRSALPFPLSVQLVATDRTPSNPYGLTIGKVTAIPEVQNEKK